MLENGRRRLQFSFTLPQASVKRAPTPYSGTLLFDAESFDLVRVVMNAPRDPGSACGDVTTIEYSGNLPTRAQRRGQGPRVPRIEIDTVFLGVPQDSRSHLENGPTATAHRWRAARRGPSDDPANVTFHGRVR
jgi:hypothetical protein